HSFARTHNEPIRENILIQIKEFLSQHINPLSDETSSGNSIIIGGDWNFVDNKLDMSKKESSCYNENLGRLLRNITNSFNMNETENDIHTWKRYHTDTTS